MSVVQYLGNERSSWAEKNSCLMDTISDKGKLNFKCVQGGSKTFQFTEYI